MRVDTFVFVHDQDIVLDFDRIGKFGDIENLRYVFLGGRPTDRISDRHDVIVARDFEENIENLASFVAFTGWHLIWKNRLSDADYINLFEYDVDLPTGFSEEQRTKLDGVDVMGYVPHGVHDYWYIGDEACAGSLLRSLNSRYGIDYRRMVDSMGDEIVGLTSNQTFSKDHFDRFMSWFEAMVPDLQDDPMCGHMPERAVSIYCKTNGVNNVSIEPGLLSHYRLDSHGTGQRDREEVAGYYKKMIGDIDSFKRIKVLTFAKGTFIQSQKLLADHLNNIGIKNQVILTNDDLPDSFKHQFEEHFSKSRGYGYWIWKPYIILDELNKLNDDDILIYIDSTDVPEKIFFEKALYHFLENDILLVNRGYNHGEWTKRDCFVFMDCDNEKYYNSVQLEAGIIGMKKTEFNLSLINEWFSNMSNLIILNDDNNICGLDNLPNFKEHRHDQSILTNLSIRYGIDSLFFNSDCIRYNHNQPSNYL